MYPGFPGCLTPFNREKSNHPGIMTTIRIFTRPHILKNWTSKFPSPVTENSKISGICNNYSDLKVVEQNYRRGPKSTFLLGKRGLLGSNDI